MQRKLVNLFPNSAGVLLLSGALALLVANLSDTGRVQLRDPIFSITMQNLFWIVSALALIVALPCLFGRQFGLKTTLVLWLALNGLVYRIGCFGSGNHGDFSACLTGPAQTFAIAPETASWLLTVALLYLAVGSASALLWSWWNGKDSLKMICAHCGGTPSFRFEILAGKPLAPIAKARSHCANRMKN